MGEAKIVLKIIADGKKLERWAGVTPGYCPKCYCPYFTVNHHRGIMHSIAPPAHNKSTPANQYEKRSLADAIKHGNFCQKQLKQSPDMSEHFKKKFAAPVSESYFTTLCQNNRLWEDSIPELHTWLNKSKRFDNRCIEIALKGDVSLKCMLAITNIADFDRLTKAIYDESIKFSEKRTRV